MDHGLDYHGDSQYYCQICTGSLEYSGRVFLDNILPKNSVLVKEVVLQYFAMFGFLTSPITVRCATNILMSLAFKLLHLLSCKCAFNELPARENNTVIGLCTIFHFFNFHLFGAPISQYGTPKWSSSDITEFCAQIPASKYKNIEDHCQLSSTKNYM